MKKATTTKLGFSIKKEGKVENVTRN